MCCLFYINIGVDLAQLVVKDILLLEGSGFMQVVELTSDGASTNKTMYKMLGISGKQTSKIISKTP